MTGQGYKGRLPGSLIAVPVDCPLSQIYSCPVPPNGLPDNHGMFFTV